MCMQWYMDLWETRQVTKVEGLPTPLHLGYHREILYDVDGWIDVTSRKHRSWHGFRHKYKYETRYFWKNEDGDATRTQKNINISMYSFIINRIILLNIQNKITGNVWIRIFFSFMKGKLQERRRDRRKHEWGDAERHGC